MSRSLRVLLVGSSTHERAWLWSHVGIPASQLTLSWCADAEHALAMLPGGFDALLVGPLARVSEANLQGVAHLAELGHAPIFLLLAGSAWEAGEWEPLIAAGIDAVIDWRDCRGPRLLGVLRCNIARAQAARAERLARVRAENVHAVLARLGSVSTRDELAEVALDAACALHADAAALLALDGDDLVLARARGLSDDQVRKLARFTVHASDHPVAVAARTQERCMRALGDGNAEEPVACGAELAGALPLIVDAKVLGVLWLTFASERDAAPECLQALELVAGHLARTLARTLEAEKLGERAAFGRLLIGIAAHDLRSPLQVVEMGTDLLLCGDAVDASKRHLLDRLRESAHRAQGLVAGLLALAKAEHGEVVPTLVEADAFQLLSDCIADFRVRSPDCPIGLSIDGSGTARIDRDHLAQVLHNLLANAIHYREADSAIEVRGLGAADRLYIEVQNRGPVLEQERMAELFAPLKRGSTRGERGSLGLGLYIVKTLVEADGGRIWARSTEGEGTTFVIELLREPAFTPCAVSTRAEHASFRPPRAAVPARYATLLRCMPEGPLTKLLEHWFELGGADGLPHPRQLDRAQLLAYLPDMFWVEVLGGPRELPSFRFAELGGVLARRLGGGEATILPGAPLSLRPSLLAAYRRCASARGPVFDYLHTGPSCPEVERFARLVLPFSRDGQHVTHLIGMALFHGFDEASARLSRQTHLFSRETHLSSSSDPQRLRVADADERSVP